MLEQDSAVLFIYLRCTNESHFPFCGPSVIFPTVPFRAFLPCVDINCIAFMAVVICLTTQSRACKVKQKVAVFYTCKSR